MRKEMVVVFLLMFLVIFTPRSYAVDITDGPPKGGDEDAVPPDFKDGVDIAEYKRAELDCIKRYDGLKREICIKEAWLAFEQSKAGERPVRDYLQEKDLVNRKYVTGLELEQLKKQYYQKLWEVNQKYKPPNFDDDIACCRFEHVENAIRNILSDIGKSYPDSLIVMDLKDPNGYLKGKIKSRKRELSEAERAVVDGLNEGKKSKDFCVSWDVPISLLESDVLQKCRPPLISEMKQVSEISKRAEKGFERFKDKRRAAIERGKTPLRECKDLQLH